VDTQEVDFHAGEDGGTDAQGDGDAGDEGAEFTLGVMCCPETDVPQGFAVWCKKGPGLVFPGDRGGGAI
jgi:hypothetical protein